MELQSDIYGLVAEFETPDELLAAAEKVRDAGFKKCDAYAPFPVHGLTEAMGFPQDPRPADRPHSRDASVPLAGFFMCIYANVFSYPLNVAGRPIEQLAVVDHHHVRVYGPVSPRSPAASACSPSTACRSRTTPCSTCRALPCSPIAIAISYASNPSDVKFGLDETRQFLEGLNPVEVSEVPQ